MKFETRVQLTILILFCLIMLALGGTYLSTKASFEADFRQKVQESLEQRKENYKNIHLLSQQHYQEHRQKHYNLHQKASELFINKVKNDKSPDVIDNQSLLHQVKQDMIDNHGLPADSDLYLINKKQTIFASTFKPDIGLDLSVFPKTAETLRQVFSNQDIYIPNLIAKDFEDMMYRVYSYSKIDEKTIFEISFVNQEASEIFQQQFFEDKFSVHTESYNIFLENGKYFYLKSDKNRKQGDAKESLYRKSAIHDADSQLSDPIIKAYFNDYKNDVFEQKDTMHTSFVKLYEQDLQNMPYVNIVMRSEVSTEGLDKSLSFIKRIFVVIALAFSLILILSHFFVQRYLIRPIKIITESIDKSDVVPMNRLNNLNKELFNIAFKYNTVYDKLNEEIKRNLHLSHVDSLTQIKNRKAFDQDIEHLITAFKQDNQQIFSFAIFDIDDFKSINDTFGHAVGDTIIKQLANIVKDNLKENHSVYRFGGEEFCILMPNLTLLDAKQNLEHVRILIESSFSGFREGSVTVSIGIVTMLVEDDFLALYKRADTLLYQAKNNGKNQICIEVK